MTTIAYCHQTKMLGADTRLNYDAYSGFGSKIYFPKRGVVLAVAGDAGEGEWLRWWIGKNNSIHDLYAIPEEERPSFENISAFVWWKGPFFISDDLYPVPIETDYWSEGTGGPYALAYLNIGWTMQDAVMGACRIDPNSGPPVHVVDLNRNPHSLKIYQDSKTTMHKAPPKV